MDSISQHFTSCIKQCSVHLKPLDEKLLKEYLEKYTANTATKNQEAEKNKILETEPRERYDKNTKNDIVTPKRKRKNCSKDQNVLKSSNADPSNMSGQKLKNTEGKAISERINPCQVWLERIPSSGEDKSQVDHEIEIIKELPKSVRKRAISYRESCKLKKMDEDELENREDNEDDKNTVIFEEEVHKEIEFEEISFEKEVIGKQLKKREITNRKKQRLVKFKRKSMTGWNSVKFKKLKAKIAEGGWGNLDPNEKSGECVSEETLKEVCASVKRLHELYKIIQQLQKELPNNTELAIHFAKVIHAQKENFQSELKKSQKIIIKCYDKMLNFYKDTKKVDFEISRLTSLGVEDVVNLIHKCILMEEHCDPDKPRINPTDIAIRGSSQKMPKRMNRSQITTTPKQTAVSDSPTTQPSNPTIRTVNNFQGPDQPLAGAVSSLGPEKNFTLSDRQALKNRSIQTCTPTAILQQSQGFNQTIPASHSILGHLLLKPNFPTNSTQLVNVGLVSQVPQSNFLPFPSGNHPPFYWYNGLQKQLLQPNRNCEVSAKVPVPHTMNTQMQPKNNGVCLVNFVPVNSNRLPHQMVTSSTMPTPHSGNSESGALDPTILQKLTMRNSRLQAGPVLDIQAESANASVKSTPQTNVNLMQKNSQSRVYVCAQNNCKNPGVQICNFCKSVIYCSETCQMKHWTTKHRIECDQLKKLRG